MASAIVYDRDAGLRQGISQAGSAFAQAISTNQERQRQEEERERLKNQKIEQSREYGSILQNTIGSLGDDASSMDMVRAYTDAINQGLPTEIATGMSSLQKALNQKAPGAGLGFDSKDDLVDLLGRFGMDEDQAQRESELYLALPTGGRTQYANFLFDRMQRGQLGANVQPRNQAKGQPNTGMLIPGGPSGDVADVSEEEVEQFDFPKVDLFEGLNSKEKVVRQKDLFNNNAKEYSEIRTKSRGYEDEMRRLGQMGRLNDSGKLPKGLENLNINWTTGDIRFPKAANAETQLFVKSVNDFTTKAKDTYGATVTNFELGTFMRRLPTLANTEEGRRMIIEQMSINAALEKLYQDSLKEVYDKYGLRNIDSQKAEQIAESLRKKDEEALLNQYDNVMQTQEVFEARQMAPEGKIPARAPTGEIVYIWIDQASKAEKKGYKTL